MYLHKGESVTVQKGKELATAWFDRKVVTIMSTNCQPDDSGSVLHLHARWFMDTGAMP